MSIECTYFGVCGGCLYQDRPYPEQLEVKRALVCDTLNGLISVPVLPTIASPKPYHYRRTISLTVKRRDGKWRLGYMGRDNRHFVPIEACAIGDERINRYMAAALKRLEESGRAHRTSQIAFRVGDSDQVATTLREDRGKTLECAVEGKKFTYDVSSFFQHNASILDSLVGVVRRLLEPAQNRLLFDLYSGVGLFSILLAPAYERVVGIEEGYQAVFHARKNAERNEVTNVSFIEGKAEEVLGRVWEGKQGSVDVICDPPRAGLKSEVIEMLAGAVHESPLQIRRLVYVSCSLESLKRDLVLLAQRFQIAAIQPIDLFPHTKHIETVVLLENRG